MVIHVANGREKVEPQIMWLWKLENPMQRYTRKDLKLDIYLTLNFFLKSTNSMRMDVIFTLPSFSEFEDSI